ncbi:alpha/beta hydrolase [Aestuariivivens sediminis]|uniref:alpha/beta hydrolase n=1 Tax=Aestuariivivens sediminis TaxID=2913557 RepID=UPI001F5A550F|nr:alpha/beta fold hydrolase [Aestuariivivens sediminis]
MMHSKLIILSTFILQSCMTISKQTKLIFEPVKLTSTYEFKLSLGTKEINIEVEKGIFLNGFLYEKEENKLLMIYFQGNAKNLQNFLDNHSMVLNWGYNVLVTDYRSFGKSNGKLSGQSQMYDDADKIYDYGILLGYKPQNIILYGYSMGTAMAGYLASTKEAKALILESAFSSIPEIGWVGNKAPNYELNTAEKAKQINIPTLLIHGDKDNVISPDHSQRIFGNLRSSKKKRIVLQNGGHGDLRKRPEYQMLINEFVNQN